MRVSTRIFVAALLVLLCSYFAFAQTPVNPSGHWEGVVQVPDNPMKIEVDLILSAGGALTGTFGQPAQGVKALPLSTVAMQGRGIRFVVKGNDEGSTFAGVLAADGTTITGDVTAVGYVIPFMLTRMGEARVAKTPISPAIGKELEGSWDGTIEADGRQMRLQLRLANQPDGTARGVIASPTGSGIEVPIAVVHSGKSVTLDIDAVGASFSGELDAAAGAIGGQWSQGSTSLPLTFRKVRR